MTADPSLAGAPAAGSGTKTPPGLYGGAMVYDAADGYTVLFGGANTTTFGLNETWEYNSTGWAPLHPTHVPAGRDDEGMAYDAKDGYVVMFGGYGVGPNGSNLELSDTWMFLHGQWTRLSPSSHPSSRYGVGMTYDATDSEVVLFGGLWYNPSFTLGKVYSDTWVFAGGSWTRLSPTVHPSARAGVGLAFDSSATVVVLFGGCSYAFGFCGRPLADTWTFSAGVWTHLTYTTRPRPGGFMLLVDDPANTSVLLSGGGNNSTLFRDTWLLTGSGWIHLTFGSPLPARILGAGASLPSGDLVFGGGNFAGTIVYRSTWLFYGGQWHKA